MLCKIKWKSTYKSSNKGKF